MQKIAHVIQFTLFIIVVHRVKSTNNNSDCPKEYSYGPDRSEEYSYGGNDSEEYNTSTVAWESNGNGIYESEPLCFDKNQTVIRRECLAGKWKPEKVPFCYRFYCPENFTPMHGGCVYITEPRSYDSGCPDARAISTLNNSIFTEFFWSPVKRKIKFGSFEYDAAGRLYGEVMQESGHLDCIVRNDNNTENNVNCTSLYSHICNYVEKDFFKQSLFENITPMEVKLKFDRNNRKMFLTVYSPELLLSDEDEDSVHCFTNAGSKLKEKQDVEKVYDSRTSSSSRKRKNFAVYEVDIEQYPGQYWCEVFSIEHDQPITSNIAIGYERERGNEYSLRVLMNNCPVKVCTSAYVYYKLLEKFCDEIRVRCRLMEIFSFGDYGTELLIHVSSKERSNVIREYYRLRNKFWMLSAGNVSVVYFRSSEVCLPHKTSSGDRKLNWKLTPLGSVTMPQEFCLKSNGMFVSRKCGGDFLYGTAWSEVDGDCADDIQIPARTQLLYDTVTNNLTADSFKHLSSVTDNFYDLSIVDLSLLADGLYQISLQNFTTSLSGDFTTSVRNIMNANSTALRQSQYILNSTDKILDAMEIFLTKGADVIDALDNLTLIQKSNLVIHITKPFKNNITGVALYGSSSNTFLEYDVVNIYRNDSFDLLNTEDLELAVFVPEDLLVSLTYNLTVEIKENISIITTVFYNDSLFNQNATQRSVQDRVVGVTIPGFGTYLETPIPMLFRSPQNVSGADCAYWDYGQTSQNKKGQWSTLGEDYLEMFKNDSFVNCAFSHLTHFALLIMSERVIITEEAGGVVTSIDAHGKHEMHLMIITAVGCSLSFMGIVGIFLTAILFERWRKKIGTKILLQLSITIILEIVTTHLAGLENWHRHRIVCMFIGILLQYIVLSQFSWMLVIAYLQYLRFVKIVGPLPSRLLLKSMIIGWILPLIPVLLCLAVSPDSYSAGVQKFCYPKGMALYVGLIAPAVTTVLANIFIFSLIMCNISQSKAKRYTKSKNTQKLQFYLAILLFFMFGIHWIFGILAEILSETWIEIPFIYLFCLTATLQGFVLFIFYVIVDKETRSLWINYFKSCI